MAAPDQFFALVADDATVASKQTGVPTSVILAQWALETGFGSSPAWRNGYNYAGVSPNGSPALYPNREQGLAAYIRTLKSSRYDAVRNAGDPLTAAKALAASPWDAGHYGGTGEPLVSIMSQYNLGRFDTAGGGGGDSTLDKLLDPLGKAKDAILSPFDKANDAVAEATIGRARTVTLWGIFVAGGTILVLAGLYRGVQPAFAKVKQKATEVAQVVAAAETGGATAAAGGAT